MDFYARARANRTKSVLFTIVAFVLLALITNLVVAYYVGLSLTSAIVAIAINLVFIIVLYFSSSRIALSLNRAQQVNYDDAPQLHNLVEEMSLASGIRKPQVYIIQDLGLNAFATGRSKDNGHVAFTLGLLQSLNREELQGVVAHEMAHIRNEDIKLMSVVAAIVTTLTIITDTAARMAFFGNNRNNSGGNPIVLILLIAGVILSPIAAILVQSAISRSRESLADATAVEFTRNPAGLRSALMVLRDKGTALTAPKESTAHMMFASPFSPRSKQFMSKLFSTHPPIQERIDALSEL